MSEAQGRRGLPLLILALGVVAIAHGSIFVRLADASPLAIAAWRLTLASAVVVPLALFVDRRVFTRLDRRLLVSIAGAGVLLAGHFATWITSLAYTSIANSVVLVATVPVWVGIIGVATGTLRLPRAMWIAIALSVVGSTVIGWGSARLGTGTVRGDLLAVAGAVCMGGYLLLAQRIQRSLPFLPFVAAIYATAAAFLWIAALGSGARLGGFEPSTWWALAGIAVVSQVIGHSSYNWSLRHLDPDLVSVTLLGEPILASLLGLLFFSEPIAVMTLAGGALVLLAILIATRAPRQPAAAAPAASAMPSTNDSPAAARESPHR